MKTHLKQVQHFSGEETSNETHIQYIYQKEKTSLRSRLVCSQSLQCVATQNIMIILIISWNTSLESRPVAKWNKKSTQRHLISGSKKEKHRHLSHCANSQPWRETRAHTTFTTDNLLDENPLQAVTGHDNQYALFTTASFHSEAIFSDHWATTGSSITIRAFSYQASCLWGSVIYYLIGII